MTELTLLGSLLGLPSIFDPIFPATYASFFGSYPPWMKESVDKMKEVEISGMKSRDDVLEKRSTISPPSPTRSNVRNLLKICCSLQLLHVVVQCTYVMWSEKKVCRIYVYICALCIKL